MKYLNFILFILIVAVAVILISAVIRAVKSLFTRDINGGNQKQTDVSVQIGSWFYNTPKLEPEEDGKIVLACAYCVGPAQILEYSVDRQGKFWREYKDVEYAFFEDDSFKEEVTQEEVISHIKGLQKLFSENGATEYAKKYEEIEDFIKNAINVHNERVL